RKGADGMTTMRYPLTLPAMLERAEEYFPHKEVVSRTASGAVRHTYREYGERVRKLSTALIELGVRKGDRVGTLAWNHHRRLGACVAVPSIGAVPQQLNPRPPPAPVATITNRAADRVILVDEDLLPLLESVRPQIKTVERVIVMSEGNAPPATALPNPAAYEA